MSDEDNKLERFKTLVKHYDLTHMYSDDNSVYRAGRDQLLEIRELAKELPRDKVEAIWNAMVDERMAQGYREQFYW